jgi:hypothetical protein
MDIKSIVEFILTDASIKTEHLHLLSQSVRERFNLIKQVNKASAKLLLKIGDKVKLHGLKPAYWNGTEGVITSFSPKKTHTILKITKSNSPKVRVDSLQSGFPLNTLELITPEPSASGENNSIDLASVDMDAIREWMVHNNA